VDWASNGTASSAAAIAVIPKPELVLIRLACTEVADPAPAADPMAVHATLFKRLGV
jgi:hypothetical protein